MALATIEETIPLGAADPALVAVRMRLVAADDLSDKFGYVMGGDLSLIGWRETSVDDTGYWSFDDVHPNTGSSDDVVNAPTGTVYEIQVTLPNVRGPIIRYVLVPDSVGPHQVQDILTDPPAALTSSALAAHLADTSDAHDASAISVLDTAAVLTATDVEAALLELVRLTRTRPRYGVRCAAVGDSNTIGYDPPTSLPTDYRPVEQSWFTHATFGSRGMLQFLTNLAVGGYTSTQIAALVSSAVTAGADVVFILAGTNDVPSWNLNTFATNIAAMVTTCRQGDVLPVILTVPPRINYVTEIYAANNWLRHWCRANRVDLIDIHGLLTDGTTSTLKSSVNYGDGLHLSEEGARVVGQAVIDWAEGRIVANDPALASYQGAQATADNLLGYAVFTDSITSGVPSGWTNLGSELTGNTTGSLPSPTESDSAGTPFVGKWYQLVKASSVLGSTVYQRISAGYSVGDTLEFSGRVQVDENWSTAGEWYVDCYLAFNGSGGSLLTPIYDLANPADLTFRLTRAVPAGTTSIDCYMRVRRVSGSLIGTVRFGQLAVRNLTVNNWGAYPS